VVLKAPTQGSPKYKAGDKVFGSAQGGYATKICASEERLRPLPKGWGFFEAAGLFVTAPTSYAALVTRAGVKKGTYIYSHAHEHGMLTKVISQAIGFSYTQQPVASASQPFK
jgi:NADPH2:quinone reductase